ncbi:caspase family protein [Streptomyces rubradiris]|uniref:Peptidase C14 caspase domain-containing protein n=1 Tax=Streptomyces rubradiris TaxID=285531 RepID=A0ABQ3RIL3_STRRR|nr:caspase family protein [Streptomyces rubradiris]GHH07089.1 hypothetical protein GCM10018792_27240 [Streptomyces rubradiris]GHI55691.1 hypothetical protein Srubr_55370 [Streptomyces rubradiris]
MILPDPHQSRAILVGVSNYTTMPKLPTVRNSVEALRYSLTGAASWNLPFQNCIAIHDPRNTEELVDPILESANAAKDTLLLYYAGHGVKGHNRGELRLTSTSSRPGAPYTATLYDDIRDILLNSSARRRIVILDCCYAGSALGIMADPTQSLADYALIEGTYLIAAAGETQPARSDGENGFTAFTGELINILRNGTPDAHLALLDLDTVFNQLTQALRAKSLPTPQRRVRNSPGTLAIAWNRQWMEQQLNKLHAASANSDQAPVNTAITAPETPLPLPFIELPPPSKQTVGKSTQSASNTDEAHPTPNRQSLRERWPAILEAVKNYRRFTWILLSQNATVIEFTEDKLHLGFSNQGGLDNYVGSGSETVLKRAISEELDIECQIQATTIEPTPPRGDRSVTAPRKSGESNFTILAIGDEIDHDAFGRGVVLSTNNSGGSAEATVDFGDGKPKRLLLKYAPIAKVTRME